MSGCCLKLKELMGSFAPKEEQIAKYVLEFPNEVIDMSIDELANACGTSVSSVVRLCKSAGYSGYKELCRTLSTDMALNNQADLSYSDVRPGDSTASIINSVCNNNIKAIQNTQSILLAEDVDKVINLICAAERVDFYGSGTSGLVAMDAHNKFVRIRKLSMSGNNAHDQVLCATSLKKGDVAVLISYSGDSKDILETADVVKNTQATMISITRYSKNLLCQRADVALFSSSSEVLIRSGVMGQRIGLLTVIDILYTGVVSRRYNEYKGFLDETRMVSARKHVNAGGREF